MITDEVTSFLRQGRLEAFAHVLRDEGIHSLDRLVLLDDNDLIQLGLKLGDRRQLQQMIYWRFVYCAAGASQLFGWGPYGMAPFCLVPWAQPPASWLNFSAAGRSQPLPASWEPPGVFEAQRPVTSQPMKVLSSSVEAFVDVGALLNIGVVRLLQDADIEVPEEAAIFSDHGFIGQACGDELRAAVKVRMDLTKRWKSSPSTSTSSRSRNFATRRQSWPRNI